MFKEYINIFEALKRILRKIFGKKQEYEYKKKEQEKPDRKEFIVLKIHEPKNREKEKKEYHWKIIAHENKKNTNKKLSDERNTVNNNVNKKIIKPKNIENIENIDKQNAKIFVEKQGNKYETENNQKNENNNKNKVFKIQKTTEKKKKPKERFSIGNLTNKPRKCPYCLSEDETFKPAVKKKEEGKFKCEICSHEWEEKINKRNKR